MTALYESFKHGLVVSKYWLCDELEKILNYKSNNKYNVYVHGSWHGLLPFIMITRKPDVYKAFYCYDIDESCKELGEQLCDTWRFEEPKVFHYTQNSNDILYNTKSNIVINCSVDQFSNDLWFDKVNKGDLVCVQCTDYNSNDWETTNIVNSIDELKNRFKFSKYLYEGIKHIDYRNVGAALHYKRFMIIGYK